VLAKLSTDIGRSSTTHKALQHDKRLGSVPHLLQGLALAPRDGKHGWVAVQQQARDVDATLHQAARVVPQVQDVPAHTLVLQSVNIMQAAPADGEQAEHVRSTGSGQQCWE